MTNDPIEERLREVIVGEIERQAIVVADYDRAWQERFRQEEARIRAALGEGKVIPPFVCPVLRDHGE